MWLGLGALQQYICLRRSWLQQEGKIHAAAAVAVHAHNVLKPKVHLLRRRVQVGMREEGQRVSHVCGNRLSGSVVSVSL
ncbi:hypothetical protein TSAR_002330 [Trichomalopsis sarcophagae]|uniref:Uncharacterized protein n=1 Tax=Trichomalopsis sarcophagae TaxID=543379 RepID=A0A232EKM0_9HYME|nr:hypothetical protein TSAR_002330 [Trichomalopsis sarcophagae]